MFFIGYYKILNPTKPGNHLIEYFSIGNGMGLGSNFKAYLVWDRFEICFFLMGWVSFIGSQPKPISITSLIIMFANIFQVQYVESN